MCTEDKLRNCERKINELECELTESKEIREFYISLRKAMKDVMTQDVTYYKFLDKEIHKIGDKLGYSTDVK